MSEDFARTMLGADYGLGLFALVLALVLLLVTDNPPGDFHD